MDGSFERRELRWVQSWAVRIGAKGDSMRVRERKARYECQRSAEGSEVIDLEMELLSFIKDAMAVLNWGG